MSEPGFIFPCRGSFSNDLSISFAMEVEAMIMSVRLLYLMQTMNVVVEAIRQSEVLFSE